MKSIYHIILAAVALTCFWQIGLQAQESGTELDFMSIGAGARPAGMGGAFGSMADDANAVYWNPAGLGCLRSPEVTWMHSDLNFGTTFDYIAAGSPLTKPRVNKNDSTPVARNFIGFGWIRTATGDILLTGIATDTIPGTNYNRVVIQGLARFLSNAYMVSIARNISSRLAAGATIKYFDMALVNYSAQGYGLDIGILWKHLPPVPMVQQPITPEPKDSLGETSKPVQASPRRSQILDPLSLSLTFTDAAFTRIKWSTGYQEKISPTVRLGVSYRIFSGQGEGNWLPHDGVAVSTDVEQQVKARRQSRWHKPLYHAGIEWKVVNMVPLRVGYDDGNFTCGIGFITRHFNLDYAYNAQEEIKAVHKLAITGKL